MRPQNLKHTVARGPLEGPEDEPDDGDEVMPELADEDWEALVPDDDYEPLPDYGDFWIESD
jgi:hypothetical protein